MNDKCKSMESKNKTAKILTKILFVLTAVFPFGLIVPIVLPGAVDEAWNTQRISSFVMAGTLFCSIFAVRMVVPHKMTGKNKIMFSGFMFFSALALRLFVIALLQAEPVSDFYTCYEYAATGNGDREYLARYPYLGAYALTLRLFLKRFGASVWNAQVYNAVVTSLIPIALYGTVSRVTGSQKTGAAAGFSYALCPSMIIYAAVPSCEHISQFFISLLLCAYAYYHTTENRRKKKWVYCIAVGIFLGAVCIYKSLFLILAPCLFLTGMLYEAGSYLENRNKKSLAAVVLQYTVMTVIAWVLVKGGIAVVRTQLQADALTGKGSYSATIYKGLCKEGNGVWNREVQQYIDQVFEEHTDKREVDRIFYGKLIDEYKEEPQALFRLIGNKFFVDWCSEDYYYWTFSGDGNMVQGSWIGEILFVIVPRIFFMMVSAVIAFGFLAAVIRGEPPLQMQFRFYMSSVIFLFAVALILMEAQGRYKSNFMPFICVLFGFGTDYMRKIRKEKR